MITDLTAGSRRYRSSVLAQLTEAQRQLDDAKTQLSEAQSERDRRIAFAVRAGFSHTEVAERIGVDRSTISQLLRRHPDLMRSVESPMQRSCLEPPTTRTLRR